MTLGFEIKGINRVRNQLRFLAAMHPSKTDPIIRDHAKRQQRVLRAKPYPAYLAHFTHVRKGFFGGIAGAFSAKKIKPGVWRVQNSSDHALGILGTRSQKFKHPSFWFWWVMKDVMEETMPELVTDLTVMIETELEGQGD